MNSLPSLLHFIILLLISGVFISCDDQEKQAAMHEKLIKDELNSRLISWQKELEKSCAERVHTKANSIVDSTLVAISRLKRDTTGILLLPKRPERPEFQSNPDTTKVRPLLNFRRDTSGGK